MIFFICIIALVFALDPQTCSSNDPQKDAVDTYIADLERNLDLAKQNSTNLAELANNKEKELDDEKKENGRISKELSDARTNSTDLAKDLGEKERELGNKKQENDRINKELDDKKKENGRIAKDLANKTAEIKELEDEVKSLLRCNPPQVVENGAINQTVANLVWPADDVGTGDRLNATYIVCDKGYEINPNSEELICECDEQLTPCGVPVGTCMKSSGKNSGALGLSVLGLFSLVYAAL